MNAMEKLGSEIRRVTELRGQYEEAARMFTGGSVSVAPVMFMIDQALKRAIAANGSNDVIAVMTYGYMMGAVFSEKPLVPRWAPVVGAVVSYLFAVVGPA